jgi:predicted RNase H-like nuclease
MHVVGVDGCPGGWIAIEYDLTDQAISPRIFASFTELIENYPRAACIAVDIPIGLAEGTPRPCDIAARKVLGSPRSSSVFPAPDRRLLGKSTYSEALELSRSLLNKGISKQGFAIHYKIAEVDQIMTPGLQARVVEVHPEVSFWALAECRPMKHPKSKLPGFEERRALLVDTFGEAQIPTREEARNFARPAKPDDVLDALSATWTAWRVAEGRSKQLPQSPTTDARGLRMGINY